MAQNNAINATKPFSPAIGGTGINNGSNTLTLAASLSTYNNLNLSSSALAQTTIGLNQSYIQTAVTSNLGLLTTATYISLNVTASGKNVSLPAANNSTETASSYTVGSIFFIKNTGNFAVDIRYSDTTTSIFSLSARESAIVTLSDNSSSNGVYDFYLLSSSQNDLVSISGTSATIEVRTAYMPTSSSLTTFTLPSTAAVGDWFKIVGQGSGGWKISQNASQKIHLNSSTTTTGTGGSLSSTNANNCIYVQCTVTNTDFTAVFPNGSFTIV